MANGKIILNIKSAAKYYDPANSGHTTGGVLPGTAPSFVPPSSTVSSGSIPTLPDGSTPSYGIGGCVDQSGVAHLIEVWQIVTCEDDGTGTGTTAEFCRLFLCSDRFAKPAGW